MPLLPTESDGAESTLSFRENPRKRADVVFFQDSSMLKSLTKKFIMHSLNDVNVSLSVCVCYVPLLWQPMNFAWLFSISAYLCTHYHKDL